MRVLLRTLTLLAFVSVACAQAPIGNEEIAYTIRNRSVTRAPQAPEAPPVPLCPPHPCGWQYTFYADYLYSKVFAEGFEFALRSDTYDLEIGKHEINSHLARMNLEWSSNYRLGALAAFKKIDTAVRFQYERIRAEGDARKLTFGFAGGSATPSVVGPNLVRNWSLKKKIEDGFLTADMHVDIRIFDLDFERKIWQFRNFTFIATGGLRGAGLTERLHIASDFPEATNNYFHSNISEMDIKNECEAVGLKFGGEGKFKMGRYFSWENRAHVALLWARFKLEQFEKFFPAPDMPNMVMGSPPLLGTQELTAESEQHIHTVKSNAFVSTSIRFLYPFRKRAISVKVGYEIDYWPSQNLLARFLDRGTQQILVVRQRGDVAFQSFVAEAALSF